MNKTAISILEKRYLKKDLNGKNIETIEDMFKRVAKTAANGDHALESLFFDMITNLDFLPNSPTLINAGNDNAQLMACFVLPIEDSMKGIFDTLRLSALVHKSGGGTGFDFSTLRPKGSQVGLTGGMATGPVSFMKVYNASTNAINQGGARRGANMGVLRVDHPDIFEFISMKDDQKDMTAFNISVALTDEFMESVKQDAEYTLRHESGTNSNVRARDVFNKIVDQAWKNGEPGVLFIDRINKKNPVPHLGKLTATNPCGETPLLPNEACVLGSVNLANHVLDGKIDYEKLSRTVSLSVEFLDNLIDVSRFPDRVITEAVLKTRKIGLGVMGFADMLIKLGVSYASDRAVEIAFDVMSFIDTVAKNRSADLSLTKGPYPACVKDNFRNATRTTIAPTGTISVIAGVSSGIEPLFSPVFVRNIMDGHTFTEVNPLLLEKYPDLTEQEIQQILKDGSVKNIDRIIDKELFTTAHEISPEQHVKIQACFQKFTDNAISKTINLSSDATRQDVENVIMLAYASGCKGITVYRDKSRGGQVLNNFNEKQETDTGRPNSLEGVTDKIKTGCGNLYITVNQTKDGIPYEVFTSTGQQGGCPSQSEAISRMVSLALRQGVSLDKITKQLQGIRCPSTMRNPSRQCLSCPDAIGRVLNQAKVITGPKEKETTVSKTKDVPCPECGQGVIKESGCTSCTSCGYSKCG